MNEDSPAFREARTKIFHFCSYRERTVGEVIEKLQKFRLGNPLIEKVVRELQEEGFLDETRYAQAFSNDKFKFNKWGRLKIRRALKQKGISEDFIERGLDSISTEEYDSILNNLLNKKWSSISSDDGNTAIKKNKVANFLIGKGFEPDLVWAKVREKTE